MTPRSDDEYVCADPFFGDESEIACRTIAVRTARKEHVCFTLNGQRDHSIMPGDRYRYERALLDGSEWGEYKICLKCMDKFLDDGDDEDDDE